MLSDVVTDLNNVAGFATRGDKAVRAGSTIVAKMIEVIDRHPNVKFFRVVDSHFDDPRDWVLEPLQTELLSDTESDEFYVIRALNVLPDGTIRDCLMNMTFPERISDYAFFLENGHFRFGYHHEFPGEIIPAAALDCFGMYELFYSKKRPEVGIEILRRGLSIAQRKHSIAEDLGYILRDEGRFQEAAEAFRIAAEEGPSSYFIYGELAAAYSKLGDVENEKRFATMFNKGRASFKTGRAWKTRPRP